ncbi:MarR family winged helix-turn-helix transcriptional regulator [Chengkuizengella axinellae]|uniref:MarR family transcriptional regulator n=1 Tax=Chengkuizengella axinellae TaxID=3064388 RepID=A0ABT9J2L1_9BACL|nr:MarR family transcriptional regulator [Chengkuizengella sp. 2205SS18-9]MDP5275808.1 MarR family transcriptional regulator [Chengkuizengella sp. 2205SS18-9]
MDDITAFYYKKLKHSSDALNAIFLEEYHKLADKEALNLTAKQNMLLELLKDRSFTNSEIAHHFSITPSASTQLVSKLEKKGYLKREINLNNRREIIVKLDEKGIELNQLMTKFELHLIQKYYSKLDEKDLENLVDLQEKLYKVAIEIQKKEET